MIIKGSYPDYHYYVGFMPPGPNIEGFDEDTFIVYNDKYVAYCYWMKRL